MRIKKAKKSPLAAEIEAVRKKEQAFLEKNAEKKASFLERILNYAKIKYRKRFLLDKDMLWQRE